MSERLTGRDDTKCSMSPWDWCGQDATCKRDCFKPEPCVLPDKLRRLAEYEDLCFDADGNEVIRLARLRELAEAEREGRVVVLPCKVGDLIYDIRGDWETGKRMLIPHRVKSVYVEQKEIGTWEWEMYVSDFAFRVTKNTQMYFTRAEAARALAEKGESDDHK